MMNLRERKREGETATAGPYLYQLPPPQDRGSRWLAGRCPHTITDGAEGKHPAIRRRLHGSRRFLGPDRRSLSGHIRRPWIFAPSGWRRPRTHFLLHPATASYYRPHPATSCAIILRRATLAAIRSSTEDRRRRSDPARSTVGGVEEHQISQWPGAPHLQRLPASYTREHAVPATRLAGNTRFRDLVYDAANLKVRASDVVVSMVAREREGGQVDRSLLKAAKDIFVDMGLGSMNYYENDLEGAVLEDAAACYRRRASCWIESDSCLDYMRRAEECLNLERERVSRYLDIRTEAKLLERAGHELVSVYSTQLLAKEQSGCAVLLRNDMVDDLSRMYRLFSGVNKGLEFVSEVFRDHVTAEGIALAKQAQESSAGERNNFVRKVIELHDKYLGHVSDCFQNHNLLHKALKASFEVVCNKSVADSSTAELLAAFADSVLQNGGSDKLSDQAVEEMLEKTVKLLAYVSDKDLFCEFCRKKLGRRLLFDKSDNVDHERYFVTKMKQQYGMQFTSKMEGMLTDLTLARDNHAEFEEFLRDNPTTYPGTGLTVTVLTTGFWPSYNSSDLNVPAEMVKCEQAFKQFYQGKTKNRKLTWIHSLGSCTLAAKFKRKTIDLIVTTYQTATLLLFNSSDRLTFSEISSQLNLADDDVVRLLHSLSCAKYKILNKVPNTKSVSRNDYFEFNSEFTDKSRRIRIPLPPLDEKKKVIEHVNKDRKYAIDASLVRIMKSRKVLGYQQLMGECIDQLSRTFKPEVKAIKTQIEDLILREFLERDADNPAVFKYLA